MFWNVTLQLFKAMGITFEIFVLTLLFSLPLGLLVAFGAMNKWKPFRFLAREDPNLGGIKGALAGFRPISALIHFLVWIIRGTPLILQLIIVFYVPGMLGFHIWTSWVLGSGRMAATVVAFVVNYACYFSVIYRGGIEGVPLGQREAGQVLGMTKSQVFFKVTLLQMVKRIVPPMSNEIITLVKDTSLARVIAIYELTFIGESFIKGSGLIWPLFYTGVYYLLFVGILTLLFNYFERRLSYFR